MNQKLNKIKISILFTILIGVILLFNFTNLDIEVQKYFYNFNTYEWAIDKEEPILRFLLYSGLKKILIFFAFVILVMLVFFRKHSFVKNYKEGLIIILLSFVIVPSTIGLLKNVSNMPCPKNVEYFNGKYPNVKIFESYPKTFKQEKRIKCWPAGHASGGFALISLFFLFKSKRNKILGMSFGVTLGWLMGIYKMLIGDHFLSHTIITMLIAYIEILFIAKFILRKNNEESTKV